MEKLKNKEGKDGKEKVKKTKETRESVETGKMESQPGTSSANVGEKEGELSQAKVKLESPGGKKVLVLMFESTLISIYKLL